jgi:hypothetical protein
MLCPFAACIVLLRRNIYCFCFLWMSEKLPVHKSEVVLMIIDPSCQKAIRPRARTTPKEIAGLRMTQRRCVEVFAMETDNLQHILL